jgi:uncharacterized MAPEG superfamily protein
MTTAYWCVLAAALIPYLTVGPAKAVTGFDNHAPREWEARLAGWRARAYWAHLNGFEVFPIFAAGVIIAHLAGAPQGRIDLLALGFVASRVAYTGLYYADWATARSIVWTAGMACVLGLFFAGA